MGSSYSPNTIHGYNLWEATSALQKALRRSDEEQALWWAVEMHRSGFGQHAFRRLTIICSEDIGPAAPGLPADIHALREAFHRERDKSHGGEPDVHLVHAVILLARAPKSRTVDNAKIWFYSEHPELIEVPDHAKDMHTAAGKKKGRGIEHFLDEGARLEGDVSLEDPYEQRARYALTHEADRPVPQSGASSEQDPQQALFPEGMPDG